MQQQLSQTPPPPAGDLNTTESETKHALTLRKTWERHLIMNRCPAPSSSPPSALKRTNPPRLRDTLTDQEYPASYFLKSDRQTGTDGTKRLRAYFHQFLRLKISHARSQRDSLYVLSPCPAAHSTRSGTPNPNEVGDAKCDTWFNS